MARDKDYRNSGFINFSYDSDDKCWSVGGSYTDEQNNQWDLGYVKCSGQGLQDAVAIVAKQMGPTLAKKGMPRKERGGKGGPE